MKLRKIKAAVVSTAIAITMFGNVSVASAAASSSTTSQTTRISVHDPSVYFDDASKQYYIYGSHLAQASTADLVTGQLLEHKDTQIRVCMQS